MWQAGTDDAAAAVHGVADDGRATRPRVVVLGGGFAGIGAAQVGDRLLERLS